MQHIERIEVLAASDGTHAAYEEHKEQADAQARCCSAARRRSSRGAWGG